MSNPFNPQQPYGQPQPGDADQPPEVPYPTAPMPATPDPSATTPISAAPASPGAQPTAKMPAASSGPPSPPPPRPPAGPQPPTFQPGKASLPQPEPEPEPKAYPKTSKFEPQDEPAGYGPPPDYAPPAGYGPPPGYAAPGMQSSPPPPPASGPPAGHYNPPPPPGSYSGPPAPGGYPGGYGGPPPPPGYGKSGYTGPPQPAPKKSNAPLIAVILAVGLLLCGGAVTAGVLVVNNVTDRAKEAIEPITNPTLPGLPTDIPDLPTDLPTVPTDLPNLPGEGKEFTVVYEVTGDGPADIVYAEKLGEQPKRISGVDLPWTLEVPMQGANLVLVSAFRTETGDGEISCRATVDGEEVAQRTREGTYASATCTKMVLN